MVAGAEGKPVGRKAVISPHPTPFTLDPKLHSLPGNYVLPEVFGYPHHYYPEPVAIAAADELRDYLGKQTDFEHDFGLDDLGRVSSRGKMFGVLVVRTPGGKVGYLAAFSGKLADSNDHRFFVPPVFDILRPGDFYKTGERRNIALTEELDSLENDPELARRRRALADAETRVNSELDTIRKENRGAKRRRAWRRKEAKATLSAADYAALEEELSRQSVERHFVLKDRQRATDAELAGYRAALAELTGRIDALREERKTRSNDLQQRIFAKYAFLDARGNRRDLSDIFAETVLLTPPAGAGECAAPKLLQYAYERGYHPVAMAEFWWGQSPKGALRSHGRYYPACRGKCEPILGHMLRGIDVEPNPLLVNPAVGKEIEVLFEDEDLLVIHKPHDFLSVPGRNIEDSVQARLRTRYPRATGPMMVHRLDMSTSGLMLVTKKKEVHKKLQEQFFKRSIEKRYVALLEGPIETDEGFIDLPLRQCIIERPRQVVDFEKGKTARTRYRVRKRGADGRTLIDLWPITGRTHQLRVHCAHAMGLGQAMVGDELYGKMGERLHLHAEWIAFVHPGTGERVVFEHPAPFV